MEKLIEVSKPMERAMGFIDGGYLRQTCTKLFGQNEIDFLKVGNKIREAFDTCLVNQFQLDLIRIYYYDAIVDADMPEYAQQKKYIDEIYNAPLYNVRLGRLIKSPKAGFRQKGVDILISTDVLTKAYLHQYETAIFIMGDRDFVPLIEAVNDAGKKTICIYYTANASKDLIKTFDMSVGIGKESLRDLLVSNNEL